MAAGTAMDNRNFGSWARPPPNETADGLATIRPLIGDNPGSASAP